MAHASARSARADVYSRITDQIVAAIEHGAGDWHMPWHHDGDSIARPRNVASDRPYRGINILALWVAATFGLRRRHLGHLSTVGGTWLPGATRRDGSSGNYVADHIASSMWRRSICGAGPERA